MKKHKREWVNDWLSNILIEDYYVTLTETIERAVKYGKLKKASQILVNFRFIKETLKISNPESLIEDYRLVLSKLLENNPYKRDFKELLTFLEKAAHLLKDKENSVSSICYGYLDETFSENIRSIKEQIISDTSDIWLKSDLPNLINQNSELKKSIPVKQDRLSSISVSDCKKWIYTGSQTGEIKIWNSNSFREEKKLVYKNSKEVIRRVYSLQEGIILVVSEYDSKTILKKWNTKNNKVIVSIDYEYQNQQYSLEESHILKISPDKNWILSRGIENDYSLIIRNTKDLEITQKIESHSQITDFQFFESKRENKWWDYLFGNQTTNTIVIYDSASYSIDYTLYSCVLNKKGRTRKKQKTKAPVFYFDGKIVPSTDKKSFFYLGYENTVEQFKLHNLEHLNSFKILPENSTQRLDRLRILSNNKELLVFTNKEKVYHWDLESNQLIKSLDTFDYLEHVEESSGKYHVINDGIFKTKIFNLETVNIETEIYNNSTHNIFKFLKETSFVSIDDAQMHIWDVSRRRRKIEFNSYGSVNSIYKVSDEIWLAGSAEGYVYGFKKEGAKYEFFLNLEVGDHINNINAFCEKGDWYLILSCGSFVFDNNRVKIIHLESEETISVFEDHKALIQKSEKIPNSNYIVSISYDYTFRIWDYKSGEIFRTGFHTLDENFTGMSIGFEIIDDFLITFSQEMINIRDIKYFDLVFEFPKFQSLIDSYAFSECKTFFATGYINGDIKIWSLKEKIELFELPNESNSIQKLYWKKIKNKDSEIKNYILSTDDTYLFLWNISEKQIFQKYKVAEVNDIVFFDGNRKFITVSASGYIIIWDIYKEQELFKCDIGRAIMKIELDEDEKMLILGEHNGQIQFLRIENLFE